MNYIPPFAPQQHLQDSLSGKDIQGSLLFPDCPCLFSVYYIIKLLAKYKRNNQQMKL